MEKRTNECVDCGKPMVVSFLERFGIYKCSGFPECRYIESLAIRHRKDWDIIYRIYKN